ncbi:DNA mismatch repair protein msh6 [Tulasnella sp. 403]|nr:DNA mismatch repair protein msh6 [Tulasnella sp. 403]
MPPKDSNLKQKTLASFFPKPSAATSAKASTKGQSSLKSSASSSTVAPETTRDVASTPDNKRVKGSSSTVQSSSSSAAKSSSSKVAETIDVDMDDDESDSVVTKRKSLKRKLIVPDDDSEPEVDLEAFSLKLSQFRKPERKTNSSMPPSEASSAPSRGARTLKKRRTSAASPEDDDFIVPSDLEEEDAPPPRSRKSSMSSSASTIDVDDDSGEEIATKKKAKSSKPTRPPTRPAGASTSGSNLFLTEAERRAKATKEDKQASEECYSFLRDIKDADGYAVDHPKYNPRTLHVPKSAWAKFTPFEKQFWEIKQKYYDTILFFQKGKFYELYENDAALGHQLFDLKLTDRVKMKMVGVPESSFELWASKFLAKGYKVAKVEQAETSLGAEMRLASEKGGAKSKASGDKIVRRELTKVLTAGTLVEGHMLTDDQAGHCVAIREFDASDEFGICILDAATGEFNLCGFVDDVCRTKLETVMRQLQPKELVYTKGNLSVATVRLLKNILPGACLWTALRESESLPYDKTLTALEEFFPPDDSAMDDDNYAQSGIPDGIKKVFDNRPAIEALGEMIWYLRQLNIDKDLLSQKNFNIYDPMKQGKGLVLDGQTLSHIEVLQNSEGTDEGSILKLLCRCVTPFGKRLFRIWLCMPLRDVQAINERLDAVDDLINHQQAETEFTKLAKGLPDLERIVSRIHAGSCKTHDFLKVLRAFEHLSKGLKSLEHEAENFESKSIPGLLRSAPDLLPYVKNTRELFEEPKEKDDQLVPRRGKDEAYDQVEDEITEVKEELDQALKKLMKKTGRVQVAAFEAKLEYWHSSIGTKEIYLVQAPASQKNIPKEWAKASGTKAVTRWSVPELNGMIRRYKEAQETRNAAIRSFKSTLYAQFDEDRDVWLKAVRVTAELDCLFSLAKASSALDKPSCRPELVESGEAFVDFVELRHPALGLKTEFIPNDVRMGGGTEGIMLLTGANMAGKSTMMRMTAAGVIMAQMGMHVPAKSARISPIDKILTRMGAYDNMFSNASTFRVEMDEACKILREATPKSLIILDELGRGTSTFDGMAIAGAVLHQLATHTLGLSLFATHYSSLTQDFQYHPNIRNMHMKTAVDDTKKELVFLYKLTEGIASSSFGTHVASLAGVPASVVDRAEVVSTDFAAHFQKKLAAKQTSTLPLVAQADFAYLWKMAQGTVSLDDDPVRAKRVLHLISRAATAYVKA